MGYWGLLRHKTEPFVEKHWAQEQSLDNQRDRSHDSGQNQVSVPANLAKSRQELNRVEVPVSESETFASISVFKEGPDTVTITESTEKDQLQAIEEKAKPTNENLPVIYPSDLHQRKHLVNRLMAKVYVTSAMTGNQTESYGKPDVYIIGVLSRYPSYPNSSYPNLAVTTERYVHHRQPMRFGLLLRYRLTDRWSVESGLSYTRLSSDITTIILDKTTVTEQRLNYIGLPLNISYELWKSRYFGLYVTGGGTIEKCLDANPWQFSLNGAAGAEYKLTNFFSLYAEPGIGYYFKDGSSTPTIYKDHPLNFNLSIGLRFNLK